MSFPYINQSFIKFLLVLSLLIGSLYTSFAQKNTSDVVTFPPLRDTLSYKKGWKIVPLPVLGYSSDLGFSFGAYAGIINFGEGNLFPKYQDQFEVLLRYNTNISGVAQLFYDSEYLIPNLRTTANLTFMLDKAFPFYGFNGYQSPYFNDINNRFYTYNRGLFKVSLDVQGDIFKHFKWVGGLSFYYYKINTTNRANYSLYDLYNAANILHEKERKGGEILYGKAGLFYDTRDFEKEPSKGIATEMTLMGCPDIFMQNGYSHVKLSIIHRQFITLWAKKLVFAYRLAYQSTIVGEAPFYVQQNLHTIFPNRTYNEGVGGDASVRGILANRIVGDGMFWANFETRIHIVNFQLFKHDITLKLNPFFDCGMVVKKYKEEELQNVKTFGSYNFTINDEERLHKAIGIGGKLILDQSFIIGLDVGFAFDGRDGNYGVYAGMNYLF